MFQLKTGDYLLSYCHIQQIKDIAREIHAAAGGEDMNVEVECVTIADEAVVTFKTTVVIPKENEEEE